MHSATALVGSDLVENSWILFGDKIDRVGTGPSWKDFADGAEIVDAQSKILTPGLIDTHVHGGGGFAAEGGLDAMRAVVNFHKSQGTTSLFLSLVSNPLNEMVELLNQARALADEQPSLVGVHLEGPFLAHSHKGAHNPEALQEPTVAKILQLIGAGGSLIKSITLAPELFDAETIKALTEANIKICVGHTNADYELAKTAFERYATVLTHAFNGMNGIHHREPGPVIAAINSPKAWLELICDGIHVLPEVARVVPPAKVILVTDAMAAAGMNDGDYLLGSLPVVVKDGIARTQQGSIAGSTLTLARAVKNYSEWIDNKVSALLAATANPKNAYNLEGIGEISLGNNADLVLWESDFTPLRIWAS